ncbi:tetratricopeptide repeat protein [Streptomyces sp. NPDC005549]|uniref:ATP-binding protein n=1 Tax=Streptomyces sp. NPDC005549 TaxID=3154888 RepID=UPI0033B1FFC5
MGGIGKTALAVEAAHRACAEGWFPGGTLFVDLRGYSGNPVTADQAVLALLDALGVQGSDLPPTATQQYDSYRALLAGRRERTLLILDNVSEPTQFLGLLPGTDRHRVLITTRDRPDAIPVRLIDLEPLDPDEAVALVTRALQDADEHDERTAQEPDAVHALVSLCGHLPLALHIAAAMLRRRRLRDIASLVTEIQKAGDPTAVLDHGSRGTDQYGRSLALRPVLAASYRRLPSDQARLLRLLALVPGADTSTEAVAALTALNVDAALELLEDLAAASLVTAVPTARDMRWRLHDLVRAFGVSVVREDADFHEEGETARERLLTFYWQWANAADDRLRWLPGKPPPERFADRAQALAWLDAERAGLVAAASWAHVERYADMATRLALCLAEYLDWRRYFDDKITITRAAQEAAHHAGESHSEAGAWNNLGLALLAVDRVEEAIDAHTRARDMFHALEDTPYEASAWNHLGAALQEAGRLEESIDAHRRARDMSHAVGNHLREADAWGNLGVALRKMGRAQDAIDAHSRARDMSQAAGDRLGEAHSWHHLGSAFRDAGRTEEAIDAYGEALAIRWEFEDWYVAASTLVKLALTYGSTHRSADARACWLQAADALNRADAPALAARARSEAENLE